MSTSHPSTGPTAAADLRTRQAYERESPRLRAWLRRHAPANLGIEDALQDLFVELLLANRAAAQIENAGAWLFHVARRRIVDALRRRRGLDPAGAGTGREHDLPAPASGQPEAKYRQAVFAQQFVAAVRELPAGQQAVFLAHELDGLSMAEIAQREGIGVNTALARKHYAVLQLRKRLAAFQDNFFHTP